MCVSSCECAVPMFHDLFLHVWTSRSQVACMDARAVCGWVQVDCVCSSPGCFQGLGPSLHPKEMVSALHSGSRWVCRWDFL